ncbi:MAG TPA: sirohydrochlorin chelatase [Cyanobacteria bacterium UBA11159]|nr:sirohydrochlorin chelatase [Cyanobacteria bacterium UBA11367]HBE58470.1 sirohydrochlorin chelatase [Cyanobacteria bacterium UBA11366]HBR74917.1 sirohydrochlorin chelatase [Cyanobacteria bacterium UBA11159]HBS69666.1 sirohydrochlorin chelatase [Cyanobacteria bacterium UBA11153]
MLTLDQTHFAPESLSLPPLPLKRPLLTIGHGTRDEEGRQAFLDFSNTYQALDRSRPVVPCFLELTGPSIQEGVDKCVEQGYTELSVLPILLFAARHNKFDVTNELDRAKLRHPQLKFYYGRHFGIAPNILDLWRNRLAQLDGVSDKSLSTPYSPLPIPNRSETVLLFVGRGSSDPDANGDVYKMARILWEGSGYKTVETCFIGITHPRLEEGFHRARFYQPKGIIVLPYFLFTGALVKKIYDITQEQQEKYPEITMTCLPEMGIQPELLSLLREREIETQLGQVQMNCEMCKFRLSAVGNGGGNGHHHHHGENGHHHHHHHGHDHTHPTSDPYADLEEYHKRIWQAP